MDIQKAKDKFKEIVRKYHIGVRAGYIETSDKPIRTAKIDGAWAILLAIGLSNAEIEKLADEAKAESASMMNQIVY